MSRGRLFRSFWTVVVTGALWLSASSPASAQQFIEETTTRFPSPNPVEYTNQLTFGDIDGDGDNDIIFANGGNFGSEGPPQLARVYINNGVGVFSDQTAARTGSLTGSHRGVELGDCDRDGDLDVVLAQDFDNLPNLLINNGSGFFTQEAASRIPNIVLSSSRGQFGDVDNDGDLDLFFTSGAGSRFGCGQYRLYINDGTCHFTDGTTTNFPILNLCDNMDCLFGDIDADFDIDLRTASRTSNTSKLYRNNGAGVFTVIAGIPNDDSTYSWDFGDIDGDGDLDMLGANSAVGSGSELMLENNGTGGYTNVSGQISPNPGDDDNDSKFFDYDNDGDMDLIIARLGGTGEKIYNNDGDGDFTLVTGLMTTNSDSSLDVKVGDLTGDGALDIVTGQGESGNFQNRIYINHGPSDTIAPRIISLEQVTVAHPSGDWVARVEVLDGMSSDRNFLDKGITLHYTIDSGPEEDVEMLHSGGQVYRGVFGTLPGNASIEYWASARDFAGNLATGLSKTFLTPDCGSVGDCFGHGSCIAVGTCNCDIGWEGADCSTFNPVAAGAVPSGDPDTPLRIRKIPGSQLQLSWDVSCGPDDEDYAVYQGALGAPFTSHVPLVCSTDGLRVHPFAPDAGDLYFLVVAKSPTSEGSYGLDSTGNPRPPSGSACEVQTIGACP